MAVDLSQTKAPFCVRLQLFEGPLDLLLHLVREQELDIYNIPIAEITDQYLGYLREMEQMDLSIAGDFLLMAATLLEIKSKMLLPKPPKPEAEDGPDPRYELVQRLLEYEKFKEVAALLRGHEEERMLVFSRAIEVDPDELPAVPSGTVTTVNLLDALRRVLENVGEGKAPITVIRRQKITLRMKMNEMLNRVKSSHSPITFQSLFSEEQTRSDVVFAFLALLELIRLRRLMAEQQSLFGDILLSQWQEPEEAQQ